MYRAHLASLTGLHKRRTTAGSRSRRLQIEQCEARTYLSNVPMPLPASVPTAAADDAGPVVEFTAELTNASGTRLRQDENGLYIVMPGSSFGAAIYVDDPRDAGSTGGVFSAYATVETDGTADELHVFSEIVYGPGFDLGQTGSVEPTKLEAVGALRSSLVPPGSDPKQLLFSFTEQMAQNIQEGETFSLTLTAGDSPPERRNLVFGETSSATGMFQDAVMIVLLHPWKNPRDRADINDDGSVGPRDLLNLVNRLLQTDLRHELGLPTVDDPPYFYDASGDNKCSPRDLVIVVNRLLAQTATTAAQAVVDLGDQSISANDTAAIPTKILPVTSGDSQPRTVAHDQPIADLACTEFNQPTAGSGQPLARPLGPNQYWSTDSGSPLERAGSSEAHQTGENAGTSMLIKPLGQECFAEGSSRGMVKAML